ncbi:hypothetical protein [Arthrobacter sp. 754]|uniref:hypothetical protein n=1 Tax=Arthrobacter sp. 754 TaxID=3156315 RepID=UPI0033954385
MNDAFLSDPRIVAALEPDVLTFLRQNPPPADADADTQIGHWMGVTATVLTKVTELSQELAQSRQRVRELEADA